MWQTQSVERPTRARRASGGCGSGASRASGVRPAGAGAIRGAKKSRRRPSDRMLWKRRVFFLGVAAALLCALFLPLQIKAWRLQAELRQLQGERQALLQQQERIQQQVGYYGSDAYVEATARQELGLVKPGEAAVLPAVPGKAKPLPQNYRSNITGPIGD